MVSTTQDNKFNENFGKELRDIIDLLIVSNHLRILNISTEIVTEDYIKDYYNIVRFYHNIPNEEEPIERQNIKRNYKDEYPFKQDSIEIIDLGYEINYFHEERPSYYKQVKFSTAEYYNDIIGKVNIGVSTYINGNQVSNTSVDSIIEGIEDLKYYGIRKLKNSFTKEYIENLNCF